jgi:hypothetical protein
LIDEHRPFTKTHPDSGRLLLLLGRRQVVDHAALAGERRAAEALVHDLPVAPLRLVEP